MSLFMKRSLTIGLVGAAIIIAVSFYLRPAYAGSKHSGIIAGTDTDRQQHG